MHGGVFLDPKNPSGPFYRLDLWRALAIVFRFFGHPMSVGARSVRVLALGLEYSDLFFAKSGDRAMMRRFRADGRCYGLLLATGCNGFDLVVRASTWFSGHFLTAFAFIQSVFIVT